MTSYEKIGMQCSSVKLDYQGLVDMAITHFGRKNEMNQIVRVAAK